MNNSTTPIPFHHMFGAISYIVIGVPTSICNLIITAAILKYEALRQRKELIIMMGLAAADAIHMGTMTANGIYRLLVVFSGQHDIAVTSAYCCRQPHMWFLSFSYPLTGLMLVAVSTDRLLLISLRRKYVFGLGRRYAWGVLGVCYGFCISFGLLAVLLALFYADPHPTLESMCYTPHGYGTPLFISKLFQQFYFYTVSMFPLLSVVIFCFVPIVNRYKQKVAPAGADLQTQLKRQQKITKAIAVSCVFTFCLVVVPGRLGFVLGDMKLMMAARVFCGYAH